MIAEDVQRKIWLWGLIGAVILGILFLIWAIFLNRGTILLHAKAPYTVTVEGLRTDNCTADACTVVVAPGDYTITLQKSGYNALSKKITVPIGAPYEDTVSLEYIPNIVETQKTPEEIFPPPPQLDATRLANLGIFASTRLFFDDARQDVYYIARNQENYRQTLYTASLKGTSPTPAGLSAPQIVTSFLRDLPNFVIAPSPDGKKVAIIDQSFAQSTLYIIDREAKNRTSLLSYPMIRDMRWIPGTNDFLFQARAAAGSPESIFLYRWDDGKILQLSLQTPLVDVAIINKDRIIAVTDQKLPEVPTPSSLIGHLVPLGENQTTAEISAALSSPVRTPPSSAPQVAGTPGVISVAPSYAFVDYSLISNDARLMIVLAKNPFPSQLKPAEDGKSVYFDQGGKIFQLRFEE